MIMAGQGKAQVFQFALMISLLIAVVASALAVIYVKHQTRQYFASLQGLQRTAEDLHVEWSQLLVEQGTWASDARVESMARQHLHMVLPKPQEVMVIGK